MALINKLRKNTKKMRGLALAGIVGSSLYLSGCGATISGLGVLRGNPAAVALGHGITALEAAEIEAEGRRDAARIRNEKNSNATMQTGQLFLRVLRFIGGPDNQFFTYNYFRGDLNQNGYAEVEEYAGFNKSEFDISENSFIRGEIYNRQGATLTIEIFDDWNRIIVKNLEEITFPMWSITHDIGRWQTKKAGYYTFVWKIGDEILGTKEIYIKDKRRLKAN